MRRLLHLLFALLLLVPVGGCDGQETAEPSSPFVGSWTRQRGTSGRTVARIWEDEGAALRFCWRLDGTGDGHSIACNVDGDTAESIDGLLSYLYVAEVHATDDPRAIEVSIQGQPKDGQSTPLSWTDRFELQEGDDEFWSYKIVFNGETRERPANPLRFTRVVDGAGD